MSISRLAFHALVLAGLGALSLSAQPQAPWPAPVAGHIPFAPGEHPRLFFRQGDLPELKRRAATPEGQYILAHLKNQLATYPYTLWNGFGYAFLHLITGDTSYNRLSQQAVQQALDGKADQDPRYNFKLPQEMLRAGPSLSAIAMAYDLGYEAWAPEFRRKVALAIQNYKPPIIDHNDTISLERLALRPHLMPESNHYGAQVGGAGLASLALLGDPDTDTALIRRYHESCVKNVLTLMNSGFGDHGWFSEYQGPAFMSVYPSFIPYMQALRVASGLDYTANRPHVRWLTLRWPMEVIPFNGDPYYPCRNPNSYGTERLLYTANKAGVSHGGYFSMGFGAVAEEDKPVVLYTYEKFVAPKQGTRFDLDNYPHHSVLALVNWPFGMAPKNPSTLLPRVMEDKHHGYYVFRKDWNGEGDILATALLRSGPLGFILGDESPSVGWAEDVMVYGLGMRTTFPGVLMAGHAVYFRRSPDGSGILSALPRADFNATRMNRITYHTPKTYDNVTSFAVDYSGASGAEALFVMTGKGTGLSARMGRTQAASLADRTGGIGGATGKITLVTAGGRSFCVMTLQKGAAPKVEARGDSVVVGGQAITFDGKRLQLRVMAGNEEYVYNTTLPSTGILPVTAPRRNRGRHGLDFRWKGRDAQGRAAMAQPRLPPAPVQALPAR